MPIIHRMINYYDIFCERGHIDRVERWFVYVAAAGFVAHIGAVALARNFPMLEHLAAGQLGYFSTFQTPFSILLVFELFLLILTIPRSITRGMGRQFEIISLITLREVFVDLGRIESLAGFAEQKELLISLLLDMTGALGMFFLVGIFYHIRKRSRSSPAPAGVERFIQLKKILSVLLSVLLGALVASTVGRWVYAEFIAVGLDVGHKYSMLLFRDIFTVMAFVDILLLTASYLYTSDYEMVFRNAGFVLSTILLRFSLAMPKPFGVGLALVAMCFGILTLLVYRYFRRIELIPEHRATL